MPRVNIYIRNEDYQKWLAIADKPEWLHMAINARVFKGVELGKPVPIPKHALQPKTSQHSPYLEDANRVKQVKDAQNNPATKPYKFPPSAASML